MNLSKPSRWKKILLKASVASIILVLTNFLLVYFEGSTIWSYAGYFFGNDIRTTQSTLLFIESAIILSLGAVWASGAMEVTFDGSNIKTNPYNRQEQWRQRPNELKQENTAGKVMILVGAPVLIAAVILILL